MKKLMHLTALLVVVVMFLALVPEQMFAQDKGDGEDRRGRGRGRWDPAQYMERRLERIKETLAFSSEEEWGAVKPLVENVMKAQMEARMDRGRGMGRGGRGGRGGGPGGKGGPGGGRGRPGRPEPGPEVKDLQNALDAEGTSAKDIKAKLKVYRTSIKKKQDNLMNAQKKLAQVLSVKQEAQLVLMGILD